jgi:hypothetical protein
MVVKSTEAFHVVKETVTVHTTIHTAIGCLSGMHFDKKKNECVLNNPPPICLSGQLPAHVNGIVQCVPPCERPDSDPETDLDKNLKTADCVTCIRKIKRMSASAHLVLRNFI